MFKMLIQTSYSYSAFSVRREERCVVCMSMFVVHILPA